MSEPLVVVLDAWPDYRYDPYEEPAAGNYSNAVWLPRLGPSSWLMWGVLASRVVVADEPITIDLAEVARHIGIGDAKRHGSTLLRTLKRLRVNRMIKPVGDGERRLLVRRYARAVSWQAFETLPPHLQALHIRTFGVMPVRADCLRP